MTIFGHLLLFLIAASIIWFFAGILVDSINKVAKRFHQSGFTVAFFVLGFFTSISEISVMVNSTLNNTPQISVGNLIGASFVILLVIVPLLAVAGKGVQLKNTLGRRNLLIALFAVLLPALLVLDGNVTKSEGLGCFLVYALLVYFIRREYNKTVPKIIKAVEKELINSNRATAIDGLKIIIGAVSIFLAGHLVVTEVGFFSSILSIPDSIIGLVILSLGTNIPELVIAIRSLLKKRKDIAFGDYLGSTVANTLVFAVLPFLNGNFSVEPTEFIFTAILMTLGFLAFYIFAKSKNAISRNEGLALLFVYLIFVGVQIANLVRFATD